MTRSELLAIPTPEETKSYKPITVRNIFNTIDDLALKNDFFIQNEMFDVKQKGQKQRMRFQFYTGTPKYAFEVAVLNSYDHKLALRAAGGGTSCICWNLVAMGDTKIVERHQGTIQENLYNFLETCFNEKTNQIQNAQTLDQAFDFVPLTRREMAELAGRLFYEEELVGPRQAEVIRKEMSNPSFKYDCNLDSLNGLYQHVTYAIQDEHPMTFLQTQQGVQSFFVEQYQEMTQNKLILL